MSDVVVASTTLSTRRRVELGLIAIGLLIIGGAYVLASLGRDASLPANLVPFLGIVMALFIAAHLVNRKLAPRADSLLLPIAALLNGLGYVMIARLNKDLASQQAAWTAIGLLGYLLTLLFFQRVRNLERLRYTFGLAGVLLSMLPLIPGLGLTIRGARIWVRLGPISFQPGEFAKLAIALFLAGYLVDRRELLSVASFKLGPLSLPEPKHLAPLLAGWGMSLVLLVFERDLGSALLFFVLFLAVLWVATGRAFYVVVGGSLFLGGGFAAWHAFTHVQTRVSMWIDPWRDPMGRGYQIVQAQYAMAWGGVEGVGLGRSISGRIPVQESDFIFAMFGEELGLFGTSAILIAYLLFCGAGFRAAMTTTDPFSKLLAVGLTTLMGVQSFIIMGGVTRLLPVTGVTLPFVSYGGSSLVANWILVALLVRISNEATPLDVAYDDRTTMLAGKK